MHILLFLVYSRPRKVGNRNKAKYCWDSLLYTLLLRIEAIGFPPFWASTIIEGYLRRLRLRAPRLVDLMSDPTACLPVVCHKTIGVLL